ncbi:MAG TPA: LLM class flavin-dependent oxidoreductase [Acidimicrobiales bacterium]|nr:LLM class flavin-dependent oxidoreductase [Acidimicrobiales bacterium]
MTASLRFGLGPLTGQTLGGTAAESTEELALVVDAAVEAERAGFATVWVSEHHLSDDGYVGSPLLLLAAIARATSTIGLGTDVALAPLHHPLRLAEEAALVDHLSRGRLLLGLGTGYRDVELRAFGIEPARRVAALEHAVSTLRDAWAGRPVLGGTVTPPPFDPVGPPILLGGYVERAVRRAGRLADGWIAPAMADPGQLATRLGWLADTGAFGRPFQIVVNIAAFVADDAWAVVGRGVVHVEERYRRWASEQGGAPGNVAVRAPAVPDRPPAHVVVGPPDACAAALRPWYDALASAPAGVVAHLNVRLHYPGVGRDGTLDAIARFGSEAMSLIEEGERQWT